MTETTIQRKNPKSPLSAPEVASALRHPPPGKHDLFTLREPHGLALRIGADGIGSYLLERKFEGKIIRRLVGYSNELTLAEARKKKDRVWSAVVSGNDPLQAKRARMAVGRLAAEERRLKRQGYRGGPGTLAALLDEFEQKKASPKWWRCRSQIEHHFKGLLDVAASRLTKADIITVLDRAVAAGSPVGGKRAARYLGRVLGWGLKRDLVTENVVSKIDLDEHTVKEQPRQRILSDTEIRSLWLACDGATPPWGVMTKSYLLCGLRREELARLKWVDLRGDGILVLGNTKTGADHRLPLSGMAQNILAMMPRVGEYIFGLSSRPNYEHFLRKLHRASGTSDWGFHDLRRTHRTLLARIRVDDLVAELMLNHQLPGKLRRTYNLHRYEQEMREAADKLAAFITTLVEDGNVVALPAAATA